MSKGTKQMMIWIIMQIASQQNLTICKKHKHCAIAKNGNSQQHNQILNKTMQPTQMDRIMQIMMMMIRKIKIQNIARDTHIHRTNAEVRMKIKQQMHARARHITTEHAMITRIIKTPMHTRTRHINREHAKIMEKIQRQMHTGTRHINAEHAMIGMIMQRPRHARTRPINE